MHGDWYHTVSESFCLSTVSSHPRPRQKKILKLLKRHMDCSEGV